MQNTIFIILGATGDLTKRKLIPALYNLYAKQVVKKDVHMICLSRRVITKDEFVKLLNLGEFIPHGNREILSKFLKQIYYYSMDFRNNRNHLASTEFIHKINREYDGKSNKCNKCLVGA